MHKDKKTQLNSETRCNSSIQSIAQYKTGLKIFTLAQPWHAKQYKTGLLEGYLITVSLYFSGYLWAVKKEVNTALT